VAADLAPDLKEGARLARESIDSGAAKERMEAFVEASTGFG